MAASRSARRSIGRGWIIATFAALVFFVLWTVVPFIWMFLASFKTNKVHGNELANFLTSTIIVPN